VSLVPPAAGTLHRVLREREPLKLSKKCQDDLKATDLQSKAPRNSLIEISTSHAFRHIWVRNQKSAHFPNICAPNYGRFCTLVFANQTIILENNERILNGVFQQSRWAAVIPQEE